MKRFLKPKLIFPLIVVMLLASAIVGSLAGNLIRAHAQAPTVSFTKDATPTVAPGGTVDYTLTLTNTSPPGTLGLHDIHLSDILPSGLTAITKGPTFTITPPTGGGFGSCTANGLTVSCTIDNFAPGSKVTITFSATVSTSATGTITNTATVQSTTLGTVTATAKTVVTAPGSITITHACPSQQTIAGPFNGVQMVTGNITLTSSDPKEASQGEKLVLQETNTLFTKTIMEIAVNTGNHLFKFFSSVVKNERLTACIQHHDSDEVGTVKLKTTPPLSFHLNLDTLKIFLIKHGLLNPTAALSLGLEFAKDTLHFRDCAEAIGNPLITTAGKLVKCTGLILGVLHLGAPDPVLKEFLRLLGVGFDGTICIAGIGASGVTVGGSIVLCIPMTIDIIQELLHPGGEG